MPKALAGVFCMTEDLIEKKALLDLKKNWAIRMRLSKRIS
jgi:hypothetical protein